MGCAGSKPHMLLSSSMNNHNSPQKGFILFNAKTIEYLIANEAEIKQKLIQRCEPKLLKTIPQSLSKSSLLGSRNGAKRTLLSNNTSNATATSSSLDNNTEKTTSKVSAVKTNKSDLSLTTSTANGNKLEHNSNSIGQVSNNNSNKFKQIAIDSAVDYVLKYAINDFDIEDFKSSNHLSMKQIRKDIMKKNTSRVSFSRLNNSMSNANGNAANGTSVNGQSATLGKETAKSYDLAFYKLALNTAIDEFGSFIQENFIVINEFEPKEEATATNIKVETSKLSEVPVDTKREGTPESNENDEDALKLKEALEVARQNFYKGKLSMVCLTKTGGYVVKEVNDKDQANENVLNVNEGLVVVSKSWTDTDINKSESQAEREFTKAEAVQIKATPQINEECVKNDNPATINESHVNTTAPKSPTKSNKETSAVPKMAIDEFLSVKNDLATVLNQTGESIVNYSTKSAVYNENSLSDSLESEINAKLFESAKSCADSLLENLEKSKNIIEILNIINEKDYNLIDEKLIESTLNLDYVNREFKSYLILLEDSLKQEKEKFESNPEQYARYTEIFAKNSDINFSVKQLSKLIEDLPSKLFVTKGFPHPSNANHSLSITSVNTTDFSKDLEELIQNRDKTSSIKQTETEPIVNPVKAVVVESVPEKNMNVKEKSNLDNNNPIDIKKEIAFSILNVGEVIAKTIDYYSLESNDAQANDLKELIKLSEDQAALERQQKIASMPKETENQATTQLHVSVENTEEKKTEINKDQQQLQTPESSASSLSSPSLGSTSPMSASGSISPIHQQNKQTSKNQTNENVVKIASPNRHEFDLIEKVKSISYNNDQPSSSKNSIQDDIAYLVEEMSTNMNSQLNCLDQFERTHAKKVHSYSVDENRQDNESDRVKSSSSSSDILSSNNDELETHDTPNNQVNVEETSSQMIVEQFISGIIENASGQYTNENDEEEQQQQVVFRNSNEKKENGSNNSKRMSLEEEICYRLEEVDKKVKYMNETCSENEDDDLDDLDDENFDYDESVEIENNNDERLFHPRTPAKIKSEVRQNRTIDLHEEIKQISNVIQDLVQTINVRNGSKNGINNEGLMDNNNSDNNNGDSEDCASQNSGSGGDYISRNNGLERRNSNKRNSGGANNSLSNIPIRQQQQQQQKVLTKQKATSVDSEETTEKAIFNEEIIVEKSPISPDSNNVRPSNNKISSQKSRSKLPIRK